MREKNEIQKAPINIEYDNVNLITCPYCGQKDTDSWESMDEDDVICDNCGKEFSYERETIMKYTSYKK